MEFVIAWADQRTDDDKVEYDGHRVELDMPWNKKVVGDDGPEGCTLPGKPIGFNAPRREC